MKKRNCLITLLLTIALVLAMSSLTFAKSKEFHGDITYDGGNSMKSDFDGEDIAALAADLEPGDDITITIDYHNRTDVETDWYLRNSVLTTLEETKSPAENGGYTYILSDSGVGEIYNNSEVGGENEGAVPEGLKQVTENRDGEYFSINTLKPGGSGTTTLYVAFDGETEVNDYQTASGDLDLQYAVEEHGVDKTEEKIIKRVVNTGDTTQILRYVLVFGASLLLLILALISHKKDKENGGEEA